MAGLWFSDIPDPVHLIEILCLTHFPPLPGIFNQYLNADKTSVLQETRMFNETPVNARKCTRILTKILFLLNQVRNEDNKVNPFLYPVSVS